MAQTRTTSSDFTHAFGDAKKQASSIAGDASDAAQDLYDHARDSASDLADSANRAARQTAGSFERALRNMIETQPYTAVIVALGLGWLFGRMHRPL
jgi:F0F1-type ATP synthase membrane subunit b/b'